MSNKAIIKNNDYFEIPLIFKGMVWGSISPTDIDACIDFKNKVFIFIEVKHFFGNLSTGQKILLERLVDNCKKPSYSIFCKHNQKGRIYLKECFVEKVYDGIWHDYSKKNVSLSEAIDKIREKHL